MSKYISKIGAYDYPAGIEIFKRAHNYYNPDLVFFDWPNDKGGLWLEIGEYEELELKKINK